MLDLIIPELKVELGGKSQFVFPAINIDQRFVDAVGALIQKRNDSSVDARPGIGQLREVSIGSRRVFAFFARLNRSRDAEAIG